MKKKLVWLLVSCLMVIALLVTSCGPAVTEKKEVPPPAEAEKEVEARPREYEVPIPYERTFSLGETVQTPNIAVTILDVIIADSYEYYDSALLETRTAKASPDKSFVIATVKIKNLLKKEEEIGIGLVWKAGVSKMRLADSKGNIYFYGFYKGADGLGALDWLHAGTTMTGKALFNIPKGTSGLKVGYDTESVYCPYTNWAEWQTGY